MNDPVVVGVAALIAGLKVARNVVVFPLWGPLWLLGWVVGKVAPNWVRRKGFLIDA